MIFHVPVPKCIYKPLEGNCSNTNNVIKYSFVAVLNSIVSSKNENVRGLFELRLTLI